MCVTIFLDFNKLSNLPNAPKLTSLSILFHNFRMTLPIVNNDVFDIVIEILTEHSATDVLKQTSYKQYSHMSRNNSKKVANSVQEPK
jgi:hypothetical protein